MEQQVISWRRDIHANPELGFQERRTADLVANHLKSLNFDEVRIGVGRTGVVGILRGGRQGPVIALRADMDALPIEEKTGLPFASRARAQWNGEEVSVMHACGHDAHVAILMGVADVLSSMRQELRGTVMFVFQPAEEGTAEGGGAEAMLKDGLFDYLKPAAIFGLHVGPFPTGTVRYRTGATAASSDSFHIHVKGKGTHGAMPWGGTDAVTTAAQIVVSLQSIVSRRLDLTANPAMISVGSLQAGNRPNIIPSDAELQGTIRTFSENDRTLIHEVLGEVSHSIAKSYGTEADVRVMKGYPVVVNDTALGAVSSPVLVSLVGDGFTEAPRGTGSEDFGFFAAQVPGFFFGLGVAPVNGSVHMNHSPYFDIDEEALTIGVQALSRLAVHYLEDR